MSQQKLQQILDYIDEYKPEWSKNSPERKWLEQQANVDDGVLQTVFNQIKDSHSLQDVNTNLAYQNDQAHPENKGEFAGIVERNPDSGGVKTGWSQDQVDKLKSYLDSDPNITPDIRKKIIGQLADKYFSNQDIVTQAKDLNWQAQGASGQAKYQLASDPKTVAEALKVDPANVRYRGAEPLDVQAFQQYVDSLDPSQRGYALRQIQAHVSGGSGSPDAAKILSQVQGDVSSAFGVQSSFSNGKWTTTAPSAAATTPATAAPTAPATTAASPDTTSTEVTQAQWDEMSQSLGFDAKAAYQAQLANDQKLMDNPRIRGAMRGDNSSLTPATPQQWLEQQKTALYGQFAPVIEQLNAQWVAAHGAQMTPELRNNLMSAINGSPELKEAVISYMADPTGAKQQGGGWNPDVNPIEYAIESGKSFANIGAFTTLEKQYAPYTPDVQATRLSDLANTRMGEWVKDFGNKPMPDDLKSQLQSMTDDQWTKKLDDQPYQNGLTHGQYTDATAAIKSKWLEAFGKEPTPAQIAWAVGKSGTEIDDFINAQPSRVSGINTGQYNAYRKAGDSMATTLFGGPMNDRMVQELHKAISPTSQTTSTPTPPPPTIAPDPKPVVAHQGVEPAVAA